MEERVVDLLQAFEAAWAAGDGEGAARIFEEGAVFTTPTFERSLGRTAIAKAEQRAYDTYFRGTRVQLEIELLRPLRPDVGLVHTSNRIFRDDVMIVESHAMLVVDGAEGAWEIVGWHNLVPLSMPPP